MSLRRGKRLRRPVDRSIYDEPVQKRRRVGDQVKSDVSRAGKEKNVGSLVRFMLFKASKSEIIKVAEMYRLLPNLTSKNKQITVRAAKARIKKLFNYEIVPVGEIIPDKDAKKFILRCNFECLEQTQNKSFQKVLVLRFVICSVILLNAGEMTEKDLYRHLEKIGLKKKKETGADTLGNVINKLIASHFLEKLKRAENERDVSYFRLGSRVNGKSDLSREGLYQFLHCVTRGEYATPEDDFLQQSKKDDKGEVDEGDVEEDYEEDSDS